MINKLIEKYEKEYEKNIKVLVKKNKRGGRMKLEVGMYVRTKNGMIAKIIDKRDVSGSLHREEIVFILDNGNKLALHSQKVIKASHNIIDLIQEGDYVNGHLVVEKRIDEELELCLESDKLIYHYIKENDIKSIVTKEQFQNIEYRFGD